MNADNQDFKYKELTGEIIRIFYQVYNKLGFLWFSGASAFSVCSAMKFKDIPISLQNLTVPVPPKKHIRSRWDLNPGHRVRSPMG